MKHNRSCWINLFFMGVLLLLAACTTPSSPATGGGQGQSRSFSSTGALYILDGLPTSGTQRIIVFRPDSATSTTALSLPMGLMSRDHLRLYTAQVHGRTTTLSVLDVRSGATLHSFVVNGSYGLASESSENAQLSGDGRWLALRDQTSSATTTRIALIDTQAARVSKIITLMGDFGLDALSPQGHIIYLLQYLDRKTYHYNVRAYTTATDALLPQVIVDKNEPGEKMQGVALTRQLAPNGSAAFTLYT
jgi:hypothetical protein